MLKSVLAVALALSPAAQASCPNGTAALSLPKSGPAKHITITDQACNPVPVGQVTIGFPALQCVPSSVNLASTTPAPTKVWITPDATGFNFQAAVSAPAMAACNVVLTFTDGSVTRSTTLTLDVPSDVTAVTLTSP